MAWNGSGSAATSAATNKKIAKPRKASSGAPMSGAFKGTLALILVLAIGAGAYWFTASDEVKAKVVEKLPKKQIAEGIKEISPTVVEANTKQESIVEKKIDDIMKNAVLRNEEARAAKQEQEQARIKNLGVTAVDQLINYAVTAPTDVPPPPMPPIMPGMEEALRRMMKNEISVKEGDSDAIIAIKQNMIENRAKMLALLDEGYAITDVLEQDHSMLENNAMMRKEAMLALKEFEENGEVESSKLYLEKVNERLEELGIEPIYGSDFARDRINRMKLRKQE